MPSRALEFEEADRTRHFPSNSGGVIVLDLTKCSIADLQRRCKEFGLKNVQRRGTEYLRALREFSSDSSKWIPSAQTPRPLSIRRSSGGKQRKNRIDQQRIEKRDRKAEIRAWLKRVDLSISGIPSHMSSPAVATKNHLIRCPPSQGIAILLTQPVSFEESSRTFHEKFTATLSRDRRITFTLEDVQNYPIVKMPNTSSLYLTKLQEIWDDDLPTWDSQNICPTIGGEKLAAKYWKDIFRKAGHWGRSKIRRRWLVWKALMSELESHDYSTSRFWKTYWDADREQGLGIQVISDRLQERKRCEQKLLKEDLSASRISQTCFELNEVVMDKGST